jgi:hypothetical protein
VIIFVAVGISLVVTWAIMLLLDLCSARSSAQYDADYVFEEDLEEALSDPEATDLLWKDWEESRRVNG